MQWNDLFVKRSALFTLAAYLLTASAVEFWNITWGTGDWLGQFSFKWLAAFVLFVLFAVLLLGIRGLVRFSRQLTRPT